MDIEFHYYMIFLIAGSLFAKYRLYVDKNCSFKSLNADRMQLIKGLRSAIGEVDQSNANKKVRIERYMELSQRMLGYEIPEYDEYAWFEEAVNEKVREEIRLIHL